MAAVSEERWRRLLRRLPDPLRSEWTSAALGGIPDDQSWAYLLATDPQMTAVWPLLEKVLKENRQYGIFVEGAVKAASANYPGARQRQRRIRHLQDEIPKAADNLVRLLQEAQKVGTNAPELTSGFAMVRAGSEISGDPWDPPGFDLRFHSNNPSTVDCVRAIALGAGQLQVRLGMEALVFATRSRKSVPFYEACRYLWAVLRDEARLRPSLRLANAMIQILEVVLPADTKFPEAGTIYKMMTKKKSR